MRSITPAELNALGPAATIIDVREPDEVARVRLPDAVGIPMSQFVERVDELPDGTLYIMCAAGARSASVTDYLDQRGYDAVNVVGGITEWERQGLPVERG